MPKTRTGCPDLPSCMRLAVTHSSIIIIFVWALKQWNLKGSCGILSLSLMDGPVIVNPMAVREILLEILLRDVNGPMMEQSSERGRESERQRESKKKV